MRFPNGQGDLNAHFWCPAIQPDVIRAVPETLGFNSPEKIANPFQS